MSGRNGTPMQRLRDRSRKGLPPERVEAVQQRRLEMQAEDAHETKLGNREFEIVNVDGTDVAPFLNKTDGDKLVDSTGLDDEVVLTDAIAVTAVSSTESAYSLGTADLKTTSQVIVQQFTVDVEDGDDLIVMASASIYAKGLVGGTRGDFVDRPTLTIYRGAVGLGATRPVAILRDNETYASAACMAIDSPPAGTHTIYFYSNLASTANVDTLTADNRFLGCLRRRRDR